MASGWQTMICWLNPSLIQFYKSEATHNHLRIVKGCFPAPIAELSSYSHDHMAHKCKNIYSPVIYREGSPTPSLQGKVQKLGVTYKP